VLDGDLDAFMEASLAARVQGYADKVEADSPQEKAAGGTSTGRAKV
jgi:hypothetical protein